MAVHDIAVIAASVDQIHTHTFLTKTGNQNLVAKTWLRNIKRV